MHAQPARAWLSRAKAGAWLPHSIGMGYLYAILALIGFSLLGVSYKLSDRLKCDGNQANLFLFLTATVVIVTRVLVGRDAAAPPAALALGLAMGVAAVITIVAFRESITKGAISTTWTITSLSLVI